MQTDTDVLRQFYAAINCNDIQAVVRDLDPEIVRTEPPGFPTSGTYRGIESVKAIFTQARATWAEGSCDPEQFLVNGDKVVAYLHVRVRLKNATDWIDARFADGFVLRNRKILEFHTFAQRTEALAWAGIEV